MEIRYQNNNNSSQLPIWIRWLISAFGIWVADWLVEGIHVESFWYAILAAIVIGLINAVLKPILMLISLPFILLTLGLFLVVINAVLLLVAGDIIPGFSVDGFWPAVWGSLIMSVISWILNANIQNGNGNSGQGISRR